MSRRKDSEIKEYKLKNGKKYFRLKTYIGTNPETGKPVKITRSKLKSRKEAEALRNKLKAEGPAAVSNKENISKRGITVANVYQSWIETVKLNVRGSTLNNQMCIWENHTRPEFGNDYIDSISPDHIQKYADELAKKYSVYKLIVNQLHRIVKYAIFRHWCHSDPFDFVLIPKKTQAKSKHPSHNFYERDELKRFLALTKKYDIMKYTYFLTVASLGCRRGEAFALKWTDVDFTKSTVRIERTVARDVNGGKTIDPVKNGVSHTVPMSKNLRNVLLAYRKHCQDIGDTCQWIFHQADYTYHWTQQVDTWIKYIYIYDKKLCQKWNKKHPEHPKKPLRRITPHGLRHTLATLLYEGNENIKPKDVQYILGHKSVKTALEIYTHVTKKQKQDITKSLNNLNL